MLLLERFFTLIRRFGSVPQAATTASTVARGIAIELLALALGPACPVPVQEQRVHRLARDGCEVAAHRPGIRR